MTETPLRAPADFSDAARDGAGAGRRRIVLGLGAAAALAGLAGCATPRQAPTLLTLPPAVGGAGLPPLAPGAPTLALRRIGLPEYLLARRVRYRADAATLVDWPNAFWAERIEVAASREFAAALRAALPGWSICEGDCAERTPTLALQVEWVSLDYRRPDRRVDGRGRWQLASIAASTATQPRTSGEQDFDETVPQDTPQGQAHAMTALLRALAQRVAQDVWRATAAAR